jgi:hypothetical protein
VKVKVYMRLARNDQVGQWSAHAWKVAASTKPNPRALTMGQGSSERELHTEHFVLELDVPEEMFKPAQWPTIAVDLSPMLPIQPIEVQLVT